MQLVPRTKKGPAKLVAKKSKLTAKKKASDTPKRRSLTGTPIQSKLKKDGKPRERTGRFSIFRPKIRGRAYPVQDNVAGWKLFDRMVKQTGLSGSDIFNLGQRLLAREFPDLTKESGISLGRRLDDTLKLKAVS